MEKLIELLNEYEQLNMCRKFDSFEMHTFEDSNGVSRILEDTVISARYGFIKWLVENDKIDYKKTHGEEWYYKLVDTCDYNGEKRCDVLLMLLSIQDEPVKFLSNILK